MSKPETNRVSEARQTFDLAGARAAGGSLATASKAHRLKVFKSGNSLALRLPKALGLEAGMELELTLEAGGGYSLKPAAAARRKFDVDAVWGIGRDAGFQYLGPEDRVFDHRPLIWDNPEWRARNMPGE
jgi:antitoxin VapB